MSQTDWLDLPGAEPVVAEPDWLDIGVGLPDYLRTDALDKPSSQITVQRADASEKDIRFDVMRGSDRVWACNGRYVACRPSGFHKETERRHAQFLSSRHYKHVGTFDDVQLFELTPQSPWYRTPGDVRAGNWYEVLRAAAMAAYARDWGAYVDLLEEIAVRLKSTELRDTEGRSDSSYAKQQFEDVLTHLQQLIFMRWSAGQQFKDVQDHGLAVQRMQAEIDNGVHNIRVARGTSRTGSVLAMPARPMIIR